MKARTLLTLLFAASFGALALTLSIESLTFFVSDDAYYYLNVARNIVAGAGSSFDGMDPTNGYHPLWMLCLLPVYGLFGSSPEIALRVSLLLQVALVSATLWLAWDVYRRYRANTLSIIVAIAIVGTLFSPVHMMFNGLETDLVILMVVLIVHEDAKRSFLAANPSCGDQVLLGLLLGLLALARLDEAFLIIGIAAWSILDRGSQSLMARMTSLCGAYWRTVVVFAMVVAPYFLWNWLEFGHLTPISGTLKATFPHPTFRPDVLIAYAPYIACTLLAGLALIPLARRSEEALSGPQHALLTGMWIGCFLQVCWALFFTSWGTFQWHFAAHIPIACMILSFYVAPLTRHRGRILSVCSAIAVAVIVLAFNLFTYNNKGDFHRGAYAAAAWARANTPKDAVFALGDAGVFGYFSERSTINLDGLINSYEYQYAVRDGHIMDFLRARHVAYIADAFTPCSYIEARVWVRSYLPPRPPMTVAWGLRVARVNEKFRSSDSVYRPLTVNRPICFIVWPFETVTLKVRDPAQPLGQPSP